MALRRYFYSGWAFLIPYLLAYLLYAIMKWPVNPGNDRPGLPNSNWIPSLLHVYQTLHAIHAILAGVALWKGWKQKHDHDDSLSTTSTLPASSLFASCQSLLIAFSPWLLLALVFYIPGAYLEWPSDPWEHLRRINEWHVLDKVTAHSSWKKSSYFLPYSLTGHTTGLVQISWLNIYCTAVCLLISWQYYRLARAAGLGERASFVFVLLNAVTFGNNVFSFYRYYGLSSSILAQLGAVVLTRIALEALGGSGTGSPTTNHEARSNLPAVAFWQNFSRSKGRTLLQSAGSILALLSLIAFNHIQGIGIAGLGILAVIVWRLIVWKRASIVWLAAAAVVLSVAAVLWFPRPPGFNEVYRSQGWLNAWYGFNFLSFSAPSSERSLQILGTFGLLNLAFGLWLVIRRNHVAGWLTLMPLVALALPCFALPLVYFVTVENPADDIIIFHRLLLAIPAALATVIAVSRPWPALRFPTLAHGCLSGALLLALAFSPGGPVGYNRLWHLIQTGPTDFNLHPVMAAWTEANPAAARSAGTLIIAPPLGTRVREAFLPQYEGWRWRQIDAHFAGPEVRRTLGWLHALPSLAASAQAGSSPSGAKFLIPAHAPRDSVDLSALGTVWSSDAKSQPEFSSFAGGLVISNPPGAASYVFVKDLIPLGQGRRYQLTVAVQQSGNPQAVNYLAVAWHGRDGTLLASSEPSPQGAGSPLGWRNGAYSYFGLVAQPAPANWRTYSISFGLGELAEIPAEAAFLRVGALLNYQETPGARTQLAKVQLREQSLPTRAIFFAPDLFTPASLAAQLSGHWSPAEAHVDYGGAVELRTASSAAAGR